MPTDAVTEPRHHLLIGGTGRAGTSFIVRYLTGLGLETTLSRRQDSASWDEDANAGLEEPQDEDPAAWPYVVKTPWVYQIVDRLLTTSAITFDAVIVPVRRLQEVAASRVILELRAMHAGQPWLSQRDNVPSERGITAGGGFMSLEPLDQARLLAVAFYNLIERLVRADVPVVFLAFPRLTEDADYLFAKLEPFLPGANPATARRVHASLSDRRMVRVGTELLSDADATAGAFPDLAVLDRVALRRELGRMQKALAAAEAGVIAARADADRATASLRELGERHAALSHRAEREPPETVARLTAVQMALAKCRAEANETHEKARELQHRNTMLSEEIGRLTAQATQNQCDLERTLAAKSAAADAQHTELRRLATRLEEVLGSASWSITAPLRLAGRRTPVGLRRRLRRGLGFIFGTRLRR